MLGGRFFRKVPIGALRSGGINGLSHISVATIGESITVSRLLSKNTTMRIRMFHDFINYDEIELQIEKEIKEDNEWIKSSTAMQTMKLGRKGPSSHFNSKSMHEHIIARGYESSIENTDIPRNATENIPQSENIPRNVPSGVPESVLNDILPNSILDNIPNESARRILSSCLTFPLTLTYAHKLLFPTLPPKLNVLIVGARAESSLPSIWWKDCLYNNKHLHEISVKMTGPGIQKPKDTESNQSDKILQWSFPASTNGILGDTSNNSPVMGGKSAVGGIENSPVADINISNIFADNSPNSSPISTSKVSIFIPYTVDNLKLLHENEDALKLLQWADVFVLYNPGMSSKPLQASWDPTIRLLLETRKPLICTAHGDTDLGNDLNFLNKISTEEDSQDIGEPLEFVIPPHLNPFRTLKRTVDKEAQEFSDGRIVTTNCYLYAVQSK